MWTFSWPKWNIATGNVLWNLCWDDYPDGKFVPFSLSYRNHLRSDNSIEMRVVLEGYTSSFPGSAYTTRGFRDVWAIPTVAWYHKKQSKLNSYSVCSCEKQRLVNSNWKHIHLCACIPHVEHSTIIQRSFLLDQRQRGWGCQHRSVGRMWGSVWGALSFISCTPEIPAPET